MSSELQAAYRELYAMALLILGRAEPNEAHGYVIPTSLFVELQAAIGKIHAVQIAEGGDGDD